MQKQLLFLRKLPHGMFIGEGLEEGLEAVVLRRAGGRRRAPRAARRPLASPRTPRARPATLALLIHAGVAWQPERLPAAPPAPRVGPAASLVRHCAARPQTRSQCRGSQCEPRDNTSKRWRGRASALATCPASPRAPALAATAALLRRLYGTSSASAVATSRPLARQWRMVSTSLSQSSGRRQSGQGPLLTCLTTPAATAPAAAAVRRQRAQAAATAAASSRTASASSNERSEVCAAHSGTARGWHPWRWSAGR